MTLLCLFSAACFFILVLALCMFARESEPVEYLPERLKLENSSLSEAYWTGASSTPELINTNQNEP